jgi:hypothetical protein
MFCANLMNHCRAGNPATGEDRHPSGRLAGRHVAAVSFGRQMLASLAHKLGPPKGGWTNQNVFPATARRGGFLARKQAGPPGGQTIWRGWQPLIWMCEGAAALNQLQNKCG